MASEFDTDFASAMAELETVHGESITITRPAVKTYNTATGGAAAGAAPTTIAATAIVEEAAERELDGLRIAGATKVTTKTAVLEGDTVTIRGMKMRVRNIQTPTVGVYEFEAVR